MRKKDNKSRQALMLVGSSAHTAHDRGLNDFYATDPKAVELLCEVENFSEKILEPACGAGHISKALKKCGYKVESRDIADYGYKDAQISDFLFFGSEKWDGDIVTNPPYSKALEFVERALDAVGVWHKVVMLLRLNFLEGQKRGRFFAQNPPARVWVSRSRIVCAMNGDFERYGKDTKSATAYAWFV